MHAECKVTGSVTGTFPCCVGSESVAGAAVVGTGSGVAISVAVVVDGVAVGVTVVVDGVVWIVGSVTVKRDAVKLNVCAWLLLYVS